MPHKDPEAEKLWRAAYVVRTRERRLACRRARRAANHDTIIAKERAYWERTKAQRLEYAAAYKAKNKEKIAARMKAYQITNKERLKAAGKIYCAANAEKANARAKAWRLANPERVKALDKAKAQRAKVNRRRNPKPRKPRKPPFSKEHHLAVAKLQRQRWVAAHRERHLESRRAWYAANKERIRVRVQKWNAANLEKVRASRRVWRAARKEIISLQTRTRKRNLVASAADGYIRILIKQQTAGALTSASISGDMMFLAREKLLNERLIRRIKKELDHGSNDRHVR